MNIKINGITTMKQLHQLDGLNIAFAGLNFYRQSSSYAGDKIVKKDLHDSDLDIKKTGVFVNADYEEIMKAVEAYSLDVVQLSGEESVHLCEQVSNEVEVIKAFAIGSDTDKSIDYILQDYDEVCDYFLFRGASNNGEDKEKFDWKKISKSKIEKPFFLGGAIAAVDAGLIKKFKHPDLYGVDLNSQFEKEAGTMDMALLLQFMQGLK